MKTGKTHKLLVLHVHEEARTGKKVGAQLLRMSLTPDGLSIGQARMSAPFSKRSHDP